MQDGGVLMGFGGCGRFAWRGEALLPVTDLRSLGMRMRFPTLSAEPGNQAAFAACRFFVNLFIACWQIVAICEIIPV